MGVRRRSLMKSTAIMAGLSAMPSVSGATSDDGDFEEVGIKHVTEVQTKFSTTEEADLAHFDAMAAYGLNSSADEFYTFTQDSDEQELITNESELIIGDSLGTPPIILNGDHQTSEVPVRSEKHAGLILPTESPVVFPASRVETEGDNTVHVEVGGSQQAVNPRESVEIQLPQRTASRQAGPQIPITPTITVHNFGEVEVHIPQ